MILVPPGYLRQILHVSVNFQSFHWPDGVSPKIVCKDKRKQNREQLQIREWIENAFSLVVVFVLFQFFPILPLILSSAYKFSPKRAYFAPNCSHQIDLISHQIMSQIRTKIKQFITKKSQSLTKIYIKKS